MKLLFFQRCLSVLLVTFIGLLLIHQPAGCQFTQTNANQTQEGLPLSELDQLNLSNLKNVRTQAPTRNPLEGPVDPDTYILGPGDVLTVSMRGGMEGIFQPVVTPDGNLIIPMAPMMTVSGLTLKVAIDSLKKKWGSHFPGTDLDISLFEIRSFLVTVTGAVPRPGLYEVTAADRASKAIALAGGLLTRDYWQLQYQSLLKSAKNLDRVEAQLDWEISSLRNSVIIHRDQSHADLDLLKFDRLHDPSSNPVLNEGDHIIVGYESQQAPTIEIAGAVRIPDVYEWREGDTVGDLIRLAGGFLPEAQPDSVQFTSFDLHGKRTEKTLSLSAGGETEENIFLHAGDLLFVPFRAAAPRRITVTVEGEVRYPGIYPAIENVTRISEIIKMAGGFTEDAFLRGSRLERQLEKDGYIERELNRHDVVQNYYRTSVQEQFRMFSSRWYGQNQVSVDFQALFEEGDDQYDVIVEDNDKIVIPDQKTNVLVMGMVEVPGLYPYVEGWNYRDYIDAAGGFTDNARKGITRLVSYGSPVWKKARRSYEIGPGDLIFVPEAPDRFAWNNFKDVFRVASQAATVIIVILNFAGK